MRGRHQKRPQRKRRQPRLHPDAHAMPMPIAPVIQCPTDQEDTGADADRAQIDHEASPEERTGHHRDRDRVPERYRERREPYDAPVMTMKSEREREQPAHRRIETMKCPQADEREPRPYCGGERVHASLFRAVSAPDIHRAPAAANSDLAASCTRACSRSAM